MKDLLAALARGLVEDKSRVSVRERPRDGVTLLELTVPSADRGRVIGRHGRTAEALRILLDAVAKRKGTRCQVEILE